MSNSDLEGLYPSYVGIRGGNPLLHPPADSETIKCLILHGRRWVDRATDRTVYGGRKPYIFWIAHITLVLASWTPLLKSSWAMLLLAEEILSLLYWS